MSQRKFRVEIGAVVTLELDSSVIAVVDDEWRSHLYDLRTPNEIAQHIAFNLLVNGIRLSSMDGWADQADDLAKLGVVDWDVTAKEILK